MVRRILFPAAEVEDGEDEADAEAGADEADAESAAGPEVDVKTDVKEEQITELDGGDGGSRRSGRLSGRSRDELSCATSGAKDWQHTNVVVMRRRKHVQRISAPTGRASTAAIAMARVVVTMIIVMPVGMT